MIEVSIVISCFQRHERLSEAIAHVQTMVASVGAEPDAFEIFVVDDCSEIADIGIQYGASVPFLRPLHYAEDKGLTLLERSPQATSIRSMAVVSEDPYRIWKSLDDGSVAPVIENLIEPYSLPRQALPSRYFQTGDIERPLYN